MGGTSSQQQQQQTISSPWAPTQAGLQGIIGQINGQAGNTGPTGAETNAFSQLQGQANAGNPYAPQIGSYATNLLNGGGATAQSGNIGDALAQYKSQLMPWANGAMGNPANNPALQQMLQTIQSDTSNSVNSQFAGAGRDMSGINQQALARGLAQGEAPALMNAQQMGLDAAGNIYNASNTTGGILSGLNQQSLANQGTGVDAGNAALAANAYGPNATLAIQAAQRGLPLNNIGSLASLLVPIAGLGGQTNSTASGTSTMSGAQQFGTIAGGLGNLAKFLPSDRRAKKDIRQIGELPNGLPVYAFRYNGSDDEHVGLMADEVDKLRPDAVKRTLLYDMVDYEKAAA